MKKFFIVTDTNKRHIAQEVMAVPVGHVVRVSEPTRSLEQNSMLWSLLTDVSKQVNWHGRMLDPESWKHMFSASLKKQDVVPNLDGTGFVVLGASTSKMSKREFSELVELIMAFGAQHGVKFSNEPIAA
jgi:hypothetical protein